MTSGHISVMRRFLPVAREAVRLAISGAPGINLPAVLRVRAPSRLSRASRTLCRIRHHLRQGKNDGATGLFLLTSAATTRAPLLSIGRFCFARLARVFLGAGPDGARHGTFTVCRAWATLTHCVRRVRVYTFSATFSLSRDHATRKTVQQPRSILRPRSRPV